MIALVTVVENRLPRLLADTFDFYLHKPVERVQMQVFPPVVQRSEGPSEGEQRSAQAPGLMPGAMPVRGAGRMHNDFRKSKEEDTLEHMLRVRISEQSRY
ncbi:hypothetical protein CYMTET_35470 [Cymbomonas tetramitiformis]|uniref:Uncharacterized protein n=1 Tax=Cymbomonas tetramitiformis TaxID=36881 RepID=A0AAE0F945_9CHLO|nr:hypothetical protein CYMTET_35470 [Cymbomonas tetramitiformis]